MVQVCIGTVRQQHDALGNFRFALPEVATAIATLQQLSQQAEMSHRHHQQQHNMIQDSLQRLPPHQRAGLLMGLGPARWPPIAQRQQRVIEYAGVYDTAL